MDWQHSLRRAGVGDGRAERVVELATGNLAALPAGSVYEHFGASMLISVFDRTFLVQSLVELGRFAEAAQHVAEMLRFAEPTQHAFTGSEAHFAAGRLHL